MKYLVILFLLITSFTLCAEQAGGDMQNKHRLVLVKQQMGATSVVVGLKTVPEFFEGSIEEYCLELANQLSTNQTVMAYKPLKQGKAYTVVSLNSGYVSFQPFTDETGMDDAQLKEALLKVN